MNMLQMGLFPAKTLTVSEANRYLKALMESDEILKDIWISGEMSTLSRPGSGHIYFTLKDENASLKCVIWKMNAMRLQIPLQTGMAVEAHGSISVYERDGQTQLYVDALRPAGEGALFQEFMQLKDKLEAEGLFAAKIKRQLPECPQTIGIVTSATGAALQDILNTLKSRYPLARVVLSPASVQGDEAPAEIISALERLNSRVHPDVILVARGGGSLEDLWAFNDEQVVRAIRASAAPVVTGIGHETDFTLADFAADLRAPTPTGAAVLSTLDINDLRGEVANQSGRLAMRMEQTLENERRNLAEIHHRLNRASPLWQIQSRQQTLDGLIEHSQREIGHLLTLKQAGLHTLNQRLAALNPQSVLQRGFALVSRQDGSLVHSVQQVGKGDPLSVTVADGDFGVMVEEP